MKRQRQIGTTEDAILRAEGALGRKLPSDFREWLLANNGTGIDGVHIYPVMDDRDPRKTWESIVHNYENGWRAWLDNFDEDEDAWDYLLPFADFGSGDYYCFNYSGVSGDVTEVVLWSHETGQTEYRANDFLDFCRRLSTDEIAD